MLQLQSFDMVLPMKGVHEKGRLRFYRQSPEATAWGMGAADA